MAKHTFYRTPKNGTNKELEKIFVWVQRNRHNQSLAIRMDDFTGPDGGPIIIIDFANYCPVLTTYQAVKDPKGRKIIVKDTIEFSGAELIKHSQIVTIQEITFLVTACRENGRTTLKFNELVNEGDGDTIEYRVSKKCYIDICQYPPNVKLNPKEVYITRIDGNGIFIDTLLNSGIISKTTRPCIYWVKLALDSDDEHDGY